MKRLHYYLVDVFTNKMFGGNQLAVFVEGGEVPPELMQLIAKEFNLSETTFVLPPQDPSNTFQLRIFTPGKELPMAGHPTVGTAFVLAREGKFERTGDETMIRFEEGVGPIPVSVLFKGDAPARATMSQPLPTFGLQVEDTGPVAEMLSLWRADLDDRLPVQVVSCGVPFLFVPVRELQSIRSIKVRLDMVDRVMSGLDTHDIFVFTREVEYEGSTVHSRMFAPSMGISEDPATGGASGPLGAYLVRYGVVPLSEEGTAHIVSEQGIEMGRPSFIHIEIEKQGDQISAVKVGGECVYVGEGFLELG